MYCTSLSRVNLCVIIILNLPLTSKLSQPPLQPLIFTHSLNCLVRRYFLIHYISAPNSFWQLATWKKLANHWKTGFRSAMTFSN